MKEFLGQFERLRENISRQNFLGNERALARILEYLPTETLRTEAPVNGLAIAGVVKVAENN